MRLLALNFLYWFYEVGTSRPAIRDQPPPSRPEHPQLTIPIIPAFSEIFINFLLEWFRSFASFARDDFVQVELSPRWMERKDKARFCSRIWTIPDEAWFLTITWWHFHRKARSSFNLTKRNLYLSTRKSKRFILNSCLSPIEKVWWMFYWQTCLK